MKRAVEHVGPQGNGSWVLGPSLFFSCMGQQLEPEESIYQCMCEWGIFTMVLALPIISACPINLPCLLTRPTEVTLLVGEGKHWPNKNSCPV